MDIDWLSIVFGAFGLGIIKLIWDVIKYYLDKKNKLTKYNNNKKSIITLFKTLMTNSLAINDLLFQFTSDIGAQRGIIFKLTNGGNIPLLGNPKKIYILYESIMKSHIKTIKSDYNGYVIDYGTRETLIPTFGDDKSYIIYSVNDMPDSFLKDIHLSHDAQHIIIFLITSIPEYKEINVLPTLIFAIFEFNHKIEVDSKLKRNIEVFKFKLKNIFDDFYLKQFELSKLN